MKENYQFHQTAGLIQRLTNISHLLLIGAIVAEKLYLRKSVFVVFKVVLHGKQITCQTDKENRLKHAQFPQGVPVWRMRTSHPNIPFIVSRNWKSRQKTEKGSNFVLKQFS